MLIHTSQLYVTLSDHVFLTQLCADWLQTQALDRKVCEALVLSCELDTLVNNFNMNQHTQEIRN